MNNLCIYVKPIYQLHSILKDHNKPPIPDEINIAYGKQQLDARAKAEYLQKLEWLLENIKKAF